MGELHLLFSIDSCEPADCIFLHLYNGGEGIVMFFNISTNSDYRYVSLELLVLQFLISTCTVYN